MFLVKNPILKRGLRFQTLQFSPNYMNSRFFFFKKNLHRRHNFYQHKLTSKQIHYPFFNYKNNLFKSSFYCVAFKKTFKKYVGVYKNYLGVYKILPLIDCIKINDKIDFYLNTKKFLKFLYLGSIMQLKFYRLFFVLSNIGVKYPKFAISLGTYIIILKKKFNKVLIKLPSNTCIWVKNTHFGVLGRNAGLYRSKEYLGKATTYYFNKTIRNRSVAKNPVDHPNGGRTRGKMLFKTPWGLLAKKSK